MSTTTTKRSLLDPVRGHRGAPPAADGPTLEELMLTAAWTVTEFDTGRRNAGLVALQRTMTDSVTGGTGGGFTLRPEMADAVWDKARTVDGPLARCTLRFTQQREFWLPGFAESSRGSGMRWGGVQGTWGLSELSVPASSQPTAGRIDFRMNQLLVNTQSISRDLLADSDLALPLLDYASQSEIRYGVESGMINGVLGGPQGVVDPLGAAGPGVVMVAKQGGQAAGSIVEGNISAMWAALYGPCRRNAVWLASDDAMDQIDEAATAGGWPSSIYLPQGVGGNPFPLVKGRPLLACEACNAPGTPADIVLADWTQYWLVVLRPRGGSSLTFDVGQPKDLGHQGIAALPEGSVQALMADQVPGLWEADEVAFRWRLRADGQPIWTSTLTTKNGGTVGWAAVLAQR